MLNVTSALSKGVNIILVFILKIFQNKHPSTLVSAFMSYNMITQDAFHFCSYFEHGLLFKGTSRGLNG